MSYIGHCCARRAVDGKQQAVLLPFVEAGLACWFGFVPFVHGAFIVVGWSTIAVTLQWTGILLPFPSNAPLDPKQSSPAPCFCLPLSNKPPPVRHVEGRPPRLGRPGCLHLLRPASPRPAAVAVQARGRVAAATAGVRGGAGGRRAPAVFG